MTETDLANLLIVKLRLTPTHARITARILMRGVAKYEELAEVGGGEKHSVTEWRFKPPLGFGNLSFRFWNWPPLDSPSWRIDIPALVRDVTGHRIVSTWGRI